MMLYLGFVTKTALTTLWWFSYS